MSIGGSTIIIQWINKKCLEKLYHVRKNDDCLISIKQDTDATLWGMKPYIRTKKGNDMIRTERERAFKTNCCDPKDTLYACLRRIKFCQLLYQNLRIKCTSHPCPLFSCPPT